MSHAGTNWAIRQRGLLPATKLVLWHLADRHNPDHGCFPSQERLADDAEVSVSQLNVHLKRLEEAGLIRRERQVNEKTRRQQPTRYILGFEDDFSQPAAESADPVAGDVPSEPTPETGGGADSVFGAEPTPVLGESRLRKTESNPVREPLREPCASAREAPPRPPGKPAVGRATRAAVSERAREGPTGLPDLDAVARLWAPAIAENRHVPPSAVSPGLARRMLALGLVISEQLRDRGIAA